MNLYRRYTYIKICIHQYTRHSQTLRKREGERHWYLSLHGIKRLVEKWKRRKSTRLLIYTSGA